ncbi:MAG: hypothetical protein ACHQ5A_12500, partial [Opitutales bacterium]
MIPARVPTKPAVDRVGLGLIAASLLAAVCWMVFRIFVGLDFTDEMQYYGEIESLVRTGKFFQNDLFIQQIGYFFLWPFFKLHAAIFPGQDYLILCGRLLLLGGYVGAGGFFWHVTGRPGGYSLIARLSGLAGHFAWIPFQLFAPSYNTLAYLEIVIVVSLWLGREPAGGGQSLSLLAAGLAVLTFTYPPAGVILSGLFVLLLARREGRRSAVRLLLLVGLSHAVVGAGFVALHGRDFLTDLQTAVHFARLYSGGVIVLMFRNQKAGLLLLLVVSSVFFWRMERRALFKYPLGAGVAPGVRYGLLALGAVAGGFLLTCPTVWTSGYASLAGPFLLLMVLAGSLGRPAGPGPAEAPGQTTPTDRMVLALLVAGGILLVARTMDWGTGYFAISVYLMLLLVLAAWARSEDGPLLTELTAVAAELGAVMAGSSGNGLHNFGVGAAGVMPFFLLYAARHLERLGTGLVPAIIRQGLLPFLVVSIVLNGMRHPYREERGLTGFASVRAVPAFAGLYTSPTKIEAIKRFRQLDASG